MDHDAVEDALSTVRRFMGFESSPAADQVIGSMNQTWIVARVHSFVQAVLPLFHRENLPSAPAERCRFYIFLRDSMNQIVSMFHTVRLQGAQSEESDAVETLLRAAARVTSALESISRAAGELQLNMGVIRNFAGVEIQEPVQEFEDLTSDTELTLLHQAAALLDAALPAMRRAATAYRRQLEKTELEVYDRSKLILTVYYQRLTDDIIQ